MDKRLVWLGIYGLRKGCIFTVVVFLSVRDAIENEPFDFILPV